MEEGGGWRTLGKSYLGTERAAAEVRRSRRRRRIAGAGGVGGRWRRPTLDRSVASFLARVEKKRLNRYDLGVALVGKYHQLLWGQLKVVGLEAVKVGGTSAVKFILRKSYRLLEATSIIYPFG